MNVLIVGEWPTQHLLHHVAVLLYLLAVHEHQSIPGHTHMAAEVATDLELRITVSTPASVMLLAQTVPEVTSIASVDDAPFATRHDRLARKGVS